MGRKTANWLQIKVVAGLGALLTGAALTVGYLGTLAEETHASQELLSRVRQLEVHGELIQRRAMTYANNAPRDYAPYDRDLIIFYPDFMRDLNAFDGQLANVAQAATGLPSGRTSAANDALADSVRQMQDGWQKFRRGLQEKLGTDADEPRLEWGAEFVRDNQALINNLTGALIHTIDQAVQQRLQRNAELTVTAITAAGIVLLLGVIWFYASVVRRISLTVRGCRRVAQGDFGYQLPEKGNDELTVLAQAFNSLSARTRFVLSMLSKMHRSGEPESKVAALWTEASGYLPLQWLGLWQANATDGTMRMMSLRSDKPIPDATLSALSNLARSDGSLLRASREPLPVTVDRLPEFVIKTPDARLLRELVKMERVNSAMMVPLASDDGWSGLLVFVAAAEEAFTQEQAELLGNLAPYMANGFANSGEAAAR